MIRIAIALSAALVLVNPSPVTADSLDDLARAVQRFRGVGHEDVWSYRVPLEIPDESEETVPLEELWRKPRELSLRAARPGTPLAIVRSLALYLEPLYVARASLLDADLGGHVERLREAAAVESRSLGERNRIAVRFPEDPQTRGLEAFQDVARLEADVDPGARLHRLELQLRGEKAPLVLECEYGEGGRPQPELAVWTLPNGDRVEVRTEFRGEGGRSLPASRLVIFPSRYDPGEQEEILVRYGTYAVNVELPDDLLSGPGAFRYDADGLVDDDGEQP